MTLNELVVGATVIVPRNYLNKLRAYFHSSLCHLLAIAYSFKALRHNRQCRVPSESIQLSSSVPGELIPQYYELCLAVRVCRIMYMFI